MAEPDIFYHREDQWQKPVLSIAPERPDPFLRHMVMRLPEEKQAEFILMVPFTPRGKDNLRRGWWRGRRRALRRAGGVSLPQAEPRVRAHADRQPHQSGHGDRAPDRVVGSGRLAVIRGNLLVIPIEESLIYVMPLYLRAQGGRIPELKRVVVAYQNRVVMEETLDAGLAQLFGGAGAATREPARVSETPGAASALSARAADLARRANESFAGRWKRSAPGIGRVTGRSCAGSRRAAAAAGRGGGAETVAAESRASSFSARVADSQQLHGYVDEPHTPLRPASVSPSL